MTNQDRQIDWDDAFSNGKYVEGSEGLPALWAAHAADFRAAHRHAEIDIPYGDHPRMRFDLFHPKGTTRGLVVFVHGGYWHKFDKSYWSHFAQGANDNGWSVAMPSYVLAPEARISEMTRQMAAALGQSASMVKGSIRLIGHSAGGHLVTRLVCQGAPLDEALQNRIEKVISLSGLHDLRPLLLTKMNTILRLDDEEAASESPVLLKPTAHIDWTAWVGGGERPEFIRQAKCMADHWQEGTKSTRLVIEGELNHFNILDALVDPKSALTFSLTGD